jgi:hypothetical protein
MMKNRIVSVVITAAVLFLGACASTFVATKNGKGYFLGSGSGAAYRMFCESGDLRKILEGTSFPQEMKDSVYRDNCGPERSSEKVKRLYASMTPEQRKELRRSFQSNGYDINYIPC